MCAHPSARQPASCKSPGYGKGSQEAGRCSGRGQPGPHPTRSVHPPGDVIYQQGSGCPSVITPCHRPVGPGGPSHPRGWGLPQDCPPLRRETGGSEAPLHCWPLLLNLALVWVSLQFLPLVAYFPQSLSWLPTSVTISPYHLFVFGHTVWLVGS